MSCLFISAPLSMRIVIIDGDGSYAAAEVSLLDDTKQTYFTMVSSNTIGAVANVRIGNTVGNNACQYIAVEIRVYN